MSPIKLKRKPIVGKRQIYRRIAETVRNYSKASTSKTFTNFSVFNISPEPETTSNIEESYISVTTGNNDFYF